MLVFEFKTYGKAKQFQAIDEAIRTTQFIRNKAIRLWMDGQAKSWVELSRHCALLAKEFPFADKLNSMARQAAAERAWASISRFYDNCKKKISGKKGYPSFQSCCRSVEYKTSGWKLSENRKSIVFSDKNGIGKLKMKGTRDLNFYQPDQIKRVRLIKRADGYYVQFCISADRRETIKPTHQTIGLDVGLESFYTDSLGNKVENPRFYRTGEQKMKRSQRLVSRKVKGSSNRRKARTRLGRVHLKISRQRKDHAVKLARCVITSNDVVVYEDLRVKNIVKNHCLAKSINDAGWYQFRVWLEYFGKVFKRITIAVNPSYTSQECSSCGVIVKKSLSTRTHVCQCGCKLDRDHNAGINILNLGLGTVGHTGTFALDASNASGETTSTLIGAILLEQAVS
ncbi:transposase [Scytonema hofmannii FACHB-248]|uniref:Transposase n=1 Tax=Scytonema hofmannii FACHB-248 TaxID=1842502 RepID=A0ABR8GTI3_9CYAN|nr:MULTISPECIES: RNA-guided endonuclease TnpB family protein [Nostocales]MBD2606532.1 transposase [Scytonema hofmannii FACHB-248]